MNIEKLQGILDALPDPSFVLSESGKYIAVYGGRDSRYYHDGSSLVGKTISELLKQDKADWFIGKIADALKTRAMVITEYELSSRDVKGLPEDGPDEPLWFEGRIQSLDFEIDGEKVVLWVASNISARHQLEVSLRHLSDTDQLTGLNNRRRMDRDLALHFAHFLRYGTPASVLMLDLDNLKHINDAQGHQTGDQILTSIADICQEQLRETDIACRFGGDEFVIVLPNTRYEQATMFAQRIHDAFEKHSAFSGKDELKPTVSIGVTAFKDTDTSYEDVLKRVDQSLYDAKLKGKNCVVVA